MAFEEIQFPTDVSRGASSTLRRQGDVITLRSGFEWRNTTWSDSRRSYNVGLGIRNISHMYEIINFWEGRRSLLNGFRFKDWSDYKSAGPNEQITNSDQIVNMSTTIVGQLEKEYSPGINSWTRDIKKPVDNGSMTIKDDTGPLVEGADYTVDYTTGIVTFSAAPTGTPKAGFEFDVPVRFANEEISINVQLAEVGEAPDIDLVEIRL